MNHRLISKVVSILLGGCILCGMCMAVPMRSYALSAPTCSSVSVEGTVPEARVGDDIAAYVSGLPSFTIKADNTNICSGIDKHIELGGERVTGEFQEGQTYALIIKISCPSRKFANPVTFSTIGWSESSRTSEDWDIYIAHAVTVKSSSPAPDPDPVTPCEEQKPPVQEESESVFAEDTYVPAMVSRDKMQLGDGNETIVPAAAYNFSSYVTPAGFAKGVEKVADKKNAAGTLTVYSSKALTINRSLLNTLTAKNTSLNYFFMHNGHLYTVTIPAGINPDLVLDKNGHVGPLTLGWLLGTSRLIK